MSRVPSTLATPRDHASPSAYRSMPGYYPTTAYNPAPVYNPAPAASPYGFTAFPASGYAPAYVPAAPYQVQYQPTSGHSIWPYVQSSDGQDSVMLGRSELLGGSPLASPQAQLPVPSQPTPHHHMPTPYQHMPTQPMPGYAMQGSPCGTAPYDHWADGSAAIYGQPAVCNWFGSVGGVLMTRDRSSQYTFSYGTGNEADQRTNTRDAEMDWSGGVGVRLGHYFNCQRNAIEAVYWGLSPNSQSTQTLSADVRGNLNGILNWNSLNYDGNTADVYVNVAPGNNGIHRLTRNYSFQNIELNLWQFCGSCDTGKCSCSRLRHNWLLGVRYFRFDENLLFASDANDRWITYDDDEIFYNIDIENNLIGFQVGNEAQYCVSDRLSADFGVKMGMYANRINHLSQIYGNWGVATINNGPFNGREFWVENSKNDVAFLGEINLGLRYNFSCRWTGTIGYRALAVTGVAMPADQIYPDLRGINDVEVIDSTRGLILHGGYAGIGYNW
ncbi:MAG TPA: BBP7 family outer membrane beta-barrel protein [Pirellulaceae bacterium]|nr:BBP7 family outer membrane beta-barrel protein [Pirellulaceae bacterium]